MHKNLIKIGCMGLLAAIICTGCGSKPDYVKNAKEKENTKATEQVSEIDTETEVPDTEIIMKNTETQVTSGLSETVTVKSIDDVKTNYSYAGTVSGFEIVDYFANETSSTKTDASISTLGEIRGITASRVLGIAKNTDLYPAEFLNATAGSNEYTAVDCNDTLSDYPTLSCQSYVNVAQDENQTHADMINDNRWMLIYSPSSKVFSNGLNKSISIETSYKNGELVAGYPSVDEELSAKYLGKPTGIVLYVADKDDLISYTLTAYWKCGKNIVTTDYIGSITKDEEALQSIHSTAAYIMPENAFNEKLAGEIKEMNDQGNEIYRYLF